MPPLSRAGGAAQKAPTDPTAELSFDAAIFDMDGVITKTAAVHSQAWKQMFDEYLRLREQRDGERFHEFTHAGDYLKYVDGRPRYKGVERFLQSRGINIPFGTPEDKSAAETICGLGNRKNEFFNRILSEAGVALFESTIALIEELRGNGIRVGVATSSKNCVQILQRAGIASLFETRVDGVVSAQLGLHGKPEPDIFTTASSNLGTPSERAIVIEDAVSGVQAGAKGKFALVIGVARENNADELRRNGADVVVRDLSEINLPQINRLVSLKRVTLEISREHPAAS